MSALGGLSSSPLAVCAVGVQEFASRLFVAGASGGTGKIRLTSLGENERDNGLLRQVHERSIHRTLRQADEWSVHKILRQVRGKHERSERSNLQDISTGSRKKRGERAGYSQDTLTGSLIGSRKAREERAIYS